MPRFLRRKTNNAKPDESQEMILLTLARAEENNRALFIADLARELEFAPESPLRALVEQSLVRADASGAFALTDAGRDRALALLRRHRLAERFFTDVLHLDWARAHEEACKFEHIVSREDEQQIIGALGEPDTCPHGNPIPPRRARRRARHRRGFGSPLSLADFAPLTCATIVRIAIETPAALQHLATLGLLPNVQIVVENRAPFDGPILVRVGRARYALGRDLAARIWVTETEH